MFASIVTRDCCQLFTVMRTDLRTYDRKVLSEFPPGDWDTAQRRARWFQEMFDPGYEHYDFRIHMCS